MKQKQSDKVNDIEEATSGGGKIFPARAVGTLNGTGTISLETSLGISSATDVNTGRYDFNFSNNFSGTRYFSCGTCSYDASSTYWRSLSNQYSGGNMDHGRTTGTARCAVLEQMTRQSKSALTSRSTPSAMYAATPSQSLSHSLAA